MSLLEIEERFRVDVPVERVWRFLLDPRQVATCLPGAELTQIVDERNFEGNLKVKVGPVTMVYKGRMTITDVDEAARRVKMVGEGVDKAGAGTAKMTMESTMTAVDGGTEVAVISKVDLAGKIVQFGRGMIKGVSQQLFKQFADSARKKLHDEHAAAAPSPAAEPAPAPGPERAPEPALPAPLPPASKPVSGLGLLFRALGASIADFFRRLFGRKKKPADRLR
jgi:carbon monoxide dehydrogenase subunit G